MNSPLETAGSVGARRSNTAPTYVIEYLVRDRADGVTPAPQFDVEGAIPSNGPSDEEQIYTFEVDRLGLIDLSFSGVLPPELAAQPSGLGQRYVVWAWGRDFILGSASPVKSANNIVGEGYVDLEDLETLPLASSQFYSRKVYVMPQGTVLRVDDMAPSTPGEPFLLRFGVVIPPTERDDALLREAICCTENIPTVTDSDEPCVTPEFANPPVTPSVLTPGATPQEIIIQATPVSDEFTTVTVSSPSGPVVPSTDPVFEFPDTIRFTAVFTIPGAYEVAISNGAGCDATDTNAFSVA